MPEVLLGAVAVRNREVRQHRLAELELDALAHLCDPERVRERLRIAAEGRGHLAGALQVHLEAAVMSGLCLGVAPALADALEIELGFAVFAAHEVHVVGRHDRQLDAARGVDEDLVHYRLLGQLVVLELYEQVSGLEHVAEPARASPRPARRRTRAPAAPPRRRDNRSARPAPSMRRRCAPASRWARCPSRDRCSRRSPAGSGSGSPRCSPQSTTRWSTSPRWSSRATFSSQPRIGWTPAALASFQCRMAPNMFAWSVSATAGMPSSFTRGASSATLTVLTRKENCVWTWRWTNSTDTVPRDPG